MGIFDHFFNNEALEKERARAVRSASDVKVDREVELQDRLRTDPTQIAKLWPSEADIEATSTFDYAGYCKAFHAAMARPLRFTETERTPGQPGYCTYKQQRAAIEEVTLSKQWQEKQRGL